MNAPSVSCGQDDPKELRQVLRRVGHAHDGTPLDHLVSFMGGRGEHIGEDGGLCGKEAAIHAEGYSLSDKDNVAVVEPEFLVMCESLRTIVSRRSRTFGWAMLLGHEGDVARRDEGGSVNCSESWHVRRVAYESPMTICHVYMY